VRPFPVIAAAAVALALALPAVAEDQAGPAGGPPAGAGGSAGNLVAAGSLGGGVEAGLSKGRPGALDLEALVGWEIPASAAGTGLVIRPELALSLGLAPDLHLALRPGVRVAMPGTPLWLRAAGDWSNARGDTRWRWLLLGVAWELRLTSLLGLFAEADTGIPLSRSAGLPLLFRVGATFRP
jgi:hypothetical protein